MKFRNWVPSAGLVENSLLENTNYTMPDSDATVTANYTPFASQPQFTKINSTSGKIDYTLNGEFIESGRRLVKAEETAEDEFSCNHEFLSTPYEINEGTENNQVPAGKYKIAVKHESKWYYSDTFTVNYGEQTIDDDKENNTEFLITLESYIDNFKNVSKSADVLNLHRNTMLYRMEKIKDILMMDLDDSEVVLNIQMGIHAKKIIDAFYK